ncbi:MAG TPA: DNA polymerase A family protein, partial [Tissierellaceae bacterium]
MYLNQEKWLAQAKERELQAHKFEEALNQYILANPDKYSKFIDKQLDLFSDERKTNINWSSPKQVLDILSISGLSVDSVNEKVIEKYRGSNELVSLYLDYKENSTAISKFGKDYLKWVNKSTGRVNTSYFQILDTGRVSSGKKDEFPNVQQLPALNEVRNCFEAEKGWKIVDCDYSAMELVIAGCVSNEDSWVEAFKNGYDLHSVVAETVYKTKWTTVAEEDCQYAINKQKCSCKEHKKMRDKIKTLNYLSLYGGGPNKLSAAINIPLEEAKQIISSYFNNLPKLSKFLDTLKHYGKTNLHIRTKKPYRRIRWFEPHNNDNNLISTIERQSGNTFIQGTGADIVKLAMNKMYSYREENKVPVKFIMQLHDAIVCEVKEEYAEEWKTLQIGFMKEAFEDVIGHTIDVDGYVEDFWKK